jgi:DNA-binding response OmpR family regulator
MMPDVDGYTVCRKIRDESRFDNMPVIFLTAKGGGEALSEGFDAGAAMYISKPFTASKLREMVKTALDARGAKT